ncbi:MAG: uroporphyrinogen decarboxylase family protein [Planctomycetota bacterium]
MMTSYERVMTALSHQRPDRPPLNYFGTPETTRRLLSHLGLASGEDLLRYFGADIRYVAPRYVGPDAFSGAFGYDTGGTDMWGIGWRPVSNDWCTYYEPVGHPLALAKTVKEIEEYRWPDIDWLSIAHVRDDVRRFNQAEPKAIVFCMGLFVEIAWAMRGLERFLMDMLQQPGIADAVLGRITTLCKEITMRALEKADGEIDIVWSSGDVGMQTGMMFSPELWRERIKPFHKELVEPFKRMGLKTRYHTDGSVVPIIEDLIEMGLDLLDPIQPNTPGMNAENLKALFAGRISFYGGVDTQRLLPYGSAREVEDEVLRLIHVLGSNGGYIVAASNAVQPDVPIENILTLYRTAREYRY